MEICSNYHVEIVHDEKTCPLCEANDTIATLKDRVGELEKDLDECEAQL